ncbi:MAG: AAA family ATPase [Pirellulales bacterium]|nr:AAA family ATPase [Pirellulales bacterium]
MPWELANSLLADPNTTLSPENRLCLQVGFSSLTGASTVEQAQQVVRHLGSYLGSNGVEQGIQALKATNVATTENLAPHLDALANHVRSAAASGPAFGRTPEWFYRPGTPTAWWSALSAEHLGNMLDEVDAPVRPERITFICENALNQAVRGEPHYVVSEVRLRAESAGDEPLLNPTFARRVGQASVNLAADATDSLHCIDPGPPDHQRPIKYRVEAHGFRAATLDVIALDSFECGGAAHVPSAYMAHAPVRQRGQQEWWQEIALQRAGVVDVEILCGTNIVSSRVTLQGEEPTDPVDLLPGSNRTSHVVDVEDQDTLIVELLTASGAVAGQWSIVFSIDETSQYFSSRFQALVAAHQATGQLGVATAPDSFMQRLESVYIATDTGPSSDSWKPVLACWIDDQPSWLEVPDWSGNAIIGDVDVSFDPRMPTSPPGSLLEAREAVRHHFAQLGRPISEIDLSEEGIQELAQIYVREYSKWLSERPEQAAWFDCVAMHAPTWNAQAGAYYMSREPIAIILSPLHPLRVGWHCVAQTRLVDALNRRCPGAGLLDPHRCPDIGAWYYEQGGSRPEPRVFISAPASNPHWQVLWNGNYLGAHNDRQKVARQLASMGLGAKSVTGGFTRNQTVASLNELAKLLSARSTLRIGVVSSNDNTSACTDGVISWCDANFDDELPDDQPPTIIDGIEIFDFRDTPDLSAEQVANLSERSQERVRWYFENGQRQPPKQDLVIVDQLGGDAPTGQSGPTRSPVTEGALWRNRIRQDTQDATWLRESRVGATCNCERDSLANLVATATIRFEELALRDSETSQLQFQPNVDAMRARLSNAIYIAITSSQMDPACIIKGAAAASSYLWDYELPGGLKGENESPGYYLIAQPAPSMRMAITEATRVVTSTNVDVGPLISEISQRGIPVLKKLATGGTHASGELGMLLAVRLIQDAFRDSPGNARLPVLRGQCVHLIVPVDPYQDVFYQLGKRLGSQLTDQRPDILVIAIKLPSGGGPVSIKLTPVEIKLRQFQQIPAADLRDMLRQAESLGRLLTTLLCEDPPNELWRVCRRGILGQLLDLGFRIYANERVHGVNADAWTEIHQRVIRDVVFETAQITVAAAGKLIAFDQSPYTVVSDLDGDGRRDTVVVSPNDAESLLVGHPPLSSAAAESIALLDLSFPDCGAGAATLDGGSADRSVVAGTSPAEEQVADVEDVECSDSGEAGSDSATVAPAAVEETSTEPDAQHVTQGAGVPAGIRDRVEQAFRGFIGNDDAVRLVKYDLLRALMGEPIFLSKNYLFTGQPSTGKTEMAKRIAVALNLPIVRLDGRGVNSRERLFELVKGELAQRHEVVSQVEQMGGLPVLQYPPLAVFIDEVHLVPTAVQESFLTMLEAADRTVTLRSEVARMDKVTFLFATTRASAIDRAFRTRCKEIQLREYSADEVAEMVRTSRHRNWPSEIYLQIATLGRCVPRVAMEIADQLDTVIAVSGPADLADHLAEVRRSLGIDDLGLTEWDIKYLDVLERHGRLGERPLLSLLGSVDRDRVIDEIEPFLTRLGYIRLTPGGRELTPEGREYILRRRRQT